jgi:hypothetical protein
MIGAACLTDDAKALLRAEAEAMEEKINNITCNNHCRVMFPNDMFGEASHIRPSHLIQFGRIGYITNRVKFQKKWVDKTTKCILVGYADDHSPDTYRMYNPDTKQVILSRDVRWADWKHTDPYTELNVFRQVAETKNESPVGIDDVASQRSVDYNAPHVIPDDLDDDKCDDLEVESQIDHT